VVHHDGAVCLAPPAAHLLECEVAIGRGGDVLAVARHAVGRAHARTDALLGQCWRPDARLAVEHRPADVVPQPLVVEYELADRLSELEALPPALESPCALALSFRRGGTCGLDRIGGRTELVRCDVCDGRGLAGSVRTCVSRGPRSHLIAGVHPVPRTITGLRWCCENRRHRPFIASRWHRSLLDGLDGWHRAGRSRRGTRRGRSNEGAPG
jgi:hypothetical protein